MAVPLPWPVVVVNEYTYPGWIVTVNFPLTGVISGCCTNHWDGLSVAKSKLLDHSCTVLPASPAPPVTSKVTCWARWSRWWPR